METKLTFNMAEAAEAVGVSIPTMVEFVQDKDFPAFKVGASLGDSLRPVKTMVGTAGRTAPPVSGERGLTWARCLTPCARA